MLSLNIIQRSAGKIVDGAYNAARGLVRHVSASEIKGADGLTLLMDMIAQTKINRATKAIDQVGDISRRACQKTNAFTKIPELPDGMSLPLYADNVIQVGKFINTGTDGISTGVNLLSGEVKTIAAKKHEGFQGFETSINRNPVLKSDTDDLTKYTKKLKRRKRVYDRSYRGPQALPTRYYYFKNLQNPDSWKLTFESLKKLFKREFWTEQVLG